MTKWALVQKLMRRCYVYRGGRKSRSAYRRLVRIAKTDPWLWVTAEAAAFSQIREGVFLKLHDEHASETGSEDT